ncbi:MAG: phage tail protein [Clostridia bacterium]
MDLLRREYLKNNKFLFFANNFSFSFAKVSNISQSIEYESIIEGGYNESPHFLPKQRTKADTITLESGIRRDLTGVVTSFLTSDYLTGLDVGNAINIGIIIVMNGLLPSKAYTFDIGVVSKVEIGELSANSGEILIKKLEITHSGLKEVQYEGLETYKF